MQRRYVWRATRVRDLLDSLYRGYPSGIILLWETDEKVPQQNFAVQQAANPYQNTQLLLDGQQRLTSLAAVLNGQPVCVRGKKRPIDILFNLEHPDELEVVTEVHEDGDLEEDGSHHDANEDELQRQFQKMTFVVATKKLAALQRWVSVSEVFRNDGDARFLEQAGVEKVSDPKYKKYSERLARLRGIRRYVYRMDILERNMSYDEVTEIFVRVNSLGAKLRSSDLALAQITAIWRNSLAIFQGFEEQCAREGFDLDLGILLRNMVAFATGRSRFEAVGNLPIARLQSAWDEGRRGLEFAISFLRSNVGIDTPTLLSSPFLVIALAYFGHRRNYALQPAESAMLRYWALAANAKGRFSRGSSETILDQDLSAIRDGADAAELVNRLRLQAGRLDISPGELVGRNQRSALFKTMFLAFRAAGATDWHSGLSIAFDHLGAQHKLQFHHVFPKDFLRGAYSAREADDIANLAFIGGRTNRKIMVKSPGEYIPALIQKIGTAPFSTQCVPVDPALLTKDTYPRFLEQRRILIAERLNSFLESSQAASA